MVFRQWFGKRTVFCQRLIGNGLKCARKCVMEVQADKIHYDGVLPEAFPEHCTATPQVGADEISVDAI